MLRTICTLPFLIVISACTGFGSAKTYVPVSPPEMRTFAASIMGKDVNNSVPVDPANQHPAIEMAPTPGKAPLIGQAPVEVLRSDPKSGAYIAFTGQVPPTRYFEIIGRADCDEWLYLQLMNADMIINRPRYYVGGEYTGDKAALKCAGVFHRKFHDKSDHRLAGADGVIFDHESAVFTDVDGWFNQNRQLHMDGWAIKFVDPTPSTIRARVAKPITAAIDIVQLRAAAYWIEKNHVSSLANDIRQVLPINNLGEALTEWKPTDRLLFRALASIEGQAEPDSVFRTVLEAGIATMLRPGNEVTVASSVLGEVPYVAANVIVCRNQPGAKEELRKVLLNATIRQHKLAAAKGLIAIGDSDFVREQLSQGRLGDISTKIMSMLSGTNVDPFACPFRSRVSA